MAAVVLVALSPLGATAFQPQRAEFVPSGLAGTNIATMQNVTTPARPARVRYVPGSKNGEAWSIAFSSAILPGWHTDVAQGQIVFMKYSPATDWQIDGPPIDSHGAIINPDLYAFDIAPDGEGWAVGATGELIHRKPGGKWIQIDSSPTTNDLHDISLVGNGSSLTGYAVGDNQTILHLQNGVWSADSNTTLVSGNLTAVSASDAQDAWTITGSGSKDLTIFRRSASGWSKISTGQSAFDGPHPVRGGSQNSTSSHIVIRQASGASVAANQDGVWIGGVMYVTDASNPTGDDTGRPFAIHLDAAGTSPRSYCPPVFALGASSNGVTQNAGAATATETDLCDEVFPAASYDLTSFQILPHGQVFAGGLGFFHFVNGAWTREPDTNGYLISIAMRNAKEGWVATTGSIYGAGGTAYSTQPTLGHWTAQPEVPRMARWPEPNFNTLEAVAVSPSGDGNAVAVGDNGAVLHYRDGYGWDTLTPSNDLVNLHDVAYNGSSSAWAVGDHGELTHFNGTQWTEDPSSSVLTSRALFSVAFNGRNGYAVGANGVILRYSGGQWSVDPGSNLTSNALYKVAATPTGFIAVGAAATVLENHGAGWRLGEHLASRITRPNYDPPALNAAATLPDGSVVIGGAQSALLRRPAGSARFTQIPFPVEGTILALAGSSTALLASVSDSDQKYIGPRLGAPAAQVLMFDGKGWHDMQLSAKQRLIVGLDPSQPTDALYGIALDSSGRSGWAAGGTLVSNQDSNGHVFSEPTAGLYRIDLDHDPSPPSDSYAPPLPDGYSFAYFGESGCLQGLCGATVGSGVSGDVVSQILQKDINTLSRVDGGPHFVVFGGNMRNLGIPEELAQYRAFLDRFDKPVWASLGDRDLFFAPDTATNLDIGSGGFLGSANASTPASNLYPPVFHSMPQPWGDQNSSTLAQFQDVGKYSVAPLPGLSRTHYSFYVKDNGQTVFQLVVLNSSQKGLSGNDVNPQEDQLTYLKNVVSPTVPSIVVMNQPTLIPYYLQGENINFSPTNAADVGIFDGIVGTGGVMSVLQSGYPINVSYVPTDLAPTSHAKFYVSGGAGRPAALTHSPLDGFYNAWLLVTVKRSGTSTTTSVQAMPVLDSLAMHAYNGNSTGAGNVLQFSGLARFPLGGTTDQNQAKALYMNIPQGGVCAGAGLANGLCVNRNALMPQYSFASSDNSIAEPVKWDYGRQLPLYDAAGNPQIDPSSGFFCTFKAGHVVVTIRTGLKQASQPVDVGGGFGPCIRKPVVVPPVPVVKPPVYVYQAPAPVKPFFFVPPFNQPQAIALFPPIPAPVVAPAPPGSPGVGRKEEHEIQTETEGHGENEFRALEIRPIPKGVLNASFTAIRSRAAPDPVGEAWPILGGVALLALMSASIVARRREQSLSWQRIQRANSEDF
ncbi:MAG: WD40/YVTN/BNR-like repeat-containing protein [Actinomycetota bacterium]